MKIKVINYGYEQLPLRAHYNDAGADVHAYIKNEENKIKIAAHSTVKIPLGFGLILPDGFMACIYPRSGLSSKGIVCELPPIDSGYRGEVHAIVSNLSDESFTVNDGDRIGQVVITPVLIAEFVDKDEDNSEERGAGAFGSTGV